TSVDVHPSSEEKLARRVERDVWNAAEECAQQHGGFADHESSTPTHSTTRFDARTARDVRADYPSNEWGGLPAPWEPFPMMTTTPVEPALASPAVAATASAADEAIHYAEHGRALEAAEAPTAHKAHADT